MARPPANLAAAMEATAEAAGWGESAAFVAGGRVLTHAEVHAGGARAASLLADLGVGQGDRVLLALLDGVEFVLAFLGAVRLGAIAVPVNPRLTTNDHHYMIQDSSAALAVCEAHLAERFSPSAAVIAAEELAAGLAGCMPHPPASVDASSPAYAQYTSGTTGAPKAAVHRHSDPLVYFDAFAAGALGLATDDVILSISKLYFAYGLGNSLFFPLLGGARAVLHAGVAMPDEISRLVEAHAVSVLFSVPTLYARLATSGRPSSFVSLRAAVSAGESLTVALARRAQDFLGCPVIDGLGSTEVGHTFVSNTIEHSRTGSVGLPLPPYEVAVRDSRGRNLPAERVGTLWVRGPTVLLEYLGRPEAASEILAQGWLCTGDLAATDSDGFVHLHGRADDIEMVAGISVAPREIEELLAGHDAVSEVAVAAVRKPDGASRLEAFVVVAPGESPGDWLAAQLVSLARAHLAPHKVPQAIRLVGDLPRTSTGKLRRFVLRSGWRG
ncbi:MAG TPA: AMP-binding protein [Acidimicrobiales bacterium]|nr:AMP-binding protein [Acidimicrobiales bacterium]